MSIATPGDLRYYILFKDDFSSFRIVYFIKNKSEAFTQFKELEVRVKNEMRNMIKTLCTDRGGEYTSKEFKKYLCEHRIRYELMAPYTPEQNRVAECKNCMIIESAHSILHDQLIECEL